MFYDKFLKKKDDSGAADEPAEGAPEPSTEPSIHADEPEEKPSKIDEYRKKSRRVKLHTLEWVAFEGRYVDTVEQVDLADLPTSALPISGRPREYLNPSRLTLPKADPKDPTASDLYLFAVNNSLTEAMTATGRRKVSFDMKQLIVYAFIAIIAVCVLYALMA